MLIEFKVANFACFRDEVTLSLVPAAKDQSLPGNIWQGNRYRALKSAAVFGANASGKTSLLHALHVLRQFVVESATKMTVGDPIPGIDTFRLSADTRDKPSCFEVLVELDGQGWRYRVEATRERVWRETLEAQEAAENSRWLTLIDRDVTRQAGAKTVLHERLGDQARRDQIVQDTRPNALVLSRAAERNVEAALLVFQWFRSHIHQLPGSRGSPSDALLLSEMAAEAAAGRPYLDRLVHLIRDADTGIVGLGTQSDDLDASLASAFSAEASGLAAGEEVSGLVGDVLQRVRRATGKPEPGAKLLRFFTLHAPAEGLPVRFDLSSESAGTLRYWLLGGVLLKHCGGPDLMIVDELDASLHPELARRVVQMAHSPEYGSAGAQLIFSTHDTTLMDPALLRRDQILLTQKKANGASELYSLWDFEKMPRNNAAWARNYLAGRFGGVPVFGPALADIRQADEPTPVQPSKAPVKAERT